MYNYTREKFDFLENLRGGEPTVFVEELTKIKESENKADQLQKKAKNDSKQTLDNARMRADQVIEEAENLAKDEYDSLLKEGHSKSDEEYDAFLAETKKNCTQMIEKAKNNENKAVELIAERIVKASVNS